MARSEKRWYKILRLEFDAGAINTLFEKIEKFVVFFNQITNNSNCCYHYNPFWILYYQI